MDAFGGFAGFGVLVAGLGFAYAQFKAGASKAKDDLISVLKDTAAVEKEKSTRLIEEKATLIKSHQEQLNELNKQIGILQGKAEANEKKMNEYLTILQGKSPDQEKFMRDTVEILGDIKDFMGQMRANGYLVKKVDTRERE